jgi:hypothetical protein
VGHIRLGILRKSQKWRRVVEQLQFRADVAAVAASAADAAEASLQSVAASDPAFLQAFWLLTQVPLAARGPAFAEDLRRLGLEVPDQPSFMDVAAAFSQAVDQYIRQRGGGRTDLGEMAQLAAVESLTATWGRPCRLCSDQRLTKCKRAFGRFSSADRFSVLAREFFARLTRRYLDYYLSRELANHIGPELCFRDDQVRSEFDDALDQHCWEVSRIIEAFAAGWYGKNVYRGDGLTPDGIRKFAPVALRKIRTELRKRRDADQ